MSDECRPKDLGLLECLSLNGGFSEAQSEGFEESARRASALCACSTWKRVNVFALPEKDFIKSACCCSMSRDPRKKTACTLSVAVSEIFEGGFVYIPYRDPVVPYQVLGPSWHRQIAVSPSSPYLLEGMTGSLGIPMSEGV